MGSRKTPVAVANASGSSNASNAASVSREKDFQLPFALDDIFAKEEVKVKDDPFDLGLKEELEKEEEEEDIRDGVLLGSGQSLPSEINSASTLEELFSIV